nr:SIMPL domain-containing protein [Brevibacillus sp. SYP-B805]
MLILALFCLVPWARPEAAHALPDAPNRHISVVGTGTVTAAPDVAYVQFGVETSGKTASEAVQKNARIFEAVKAALIKAGVAEKDIQTTQFNTFPVYDNQKLTGYRVQQIVRVTYRDVGNVGRLLDQLSAAGVNRVDALSFGTEKRDEYEKKALDQAVQDARAKAEVLAAAAGVRIRGVVSITEGGAAPPPIVYSQRQAAELGRIAPTEIFAGEIKIEASVNVIYSF